MCSSKITTLDPNVYLTDLTGELGSTSVTMFAYTLRQSNVNHCQACSSYKLHPLISWVPALYEHTRIIRPLEQTIIGVASAVDLDLMFIVDRLEWNTWACRTVSLQSHCSVSWTWVDHANKLIFLFLVWQIWIFRSDSSAPVLFEWSSLTETVTSQISRYYSDMEPPLKVMMNHVVELWIAERRLFWDDCWTVLFTFKRVLHWDILCLDFGGDLIHSTNGRLRPK